MPGPGALSVVASPTPQISRGEEEEKLGVGQLTVVDGQNDIGGHPIDRGSLFIIVIIGEAVNRPVERKLVENFGVDISLTVSGSKANLTL